jgi:hypothetical protein
MNVVDGEHFTQPRYFWVGSNSRVVSMLLLHRKVSGADLTGVGKPVR